MKSMLFGICAFLGFLSVALMFGIALRRQIASALPVVRENIDRFRKIPPLHKALLLIFVSGFVVYGSTKTNLVDQTSGTNDVGIVEGNGTNAPPMMLMMPIPFADDTFSTITPEDIARGWQLWEVRTNHNVCYTMPVDATLCSNWWVRGAFEDVSRIDLTGWRFPFGSNEYSSAWAFSWGKVRLALADTNTEIVAVGVPMSAVPYRSRLWSAADTNGAKVVTWENFALDRDTNTPVNAQIELRTTGDFVTRSNEVEKVYRRVDPDDWDGDGWRNDDDPDPYVWEEYWDSFWQELPDGANESAYCWIEIRPRWHSYIEFVGDGPSDLDDPYLWAKAGETYRVQLLIGKTYSIESTQPIDVVGRSDSSIEVDGNGTCELEVVWPVRFSALEGNGSGFMMRVVPSGLGGTFTWTQHCCTITGYGNQFWWAYARYCSCGGCYASGFYSYEGYELECIGGHCGCPYYDDDDPYESEEDDGPYAAGASVEFSESAVIFEDAYTNMPGEVVARQSTRTTLTCVAHGGDTGGTATFTIENGDKLIACSGGSLPVTRFVPPLQKVEFEIVYEGQLPSGSEEDIIAKADFTERVTGTRHSTQRDWLTSVKARIQASQTAVDNPNRDRHIYGVGEELSLICVPGSCVTSASASFGTLTDIQNGHADYTSPAEADSPVITVNCGSSQKDIQLEVFEPEGYMVQSISADFYGLPNEAGSFDLHFTNRILPLYVSFYAIEVTEIAMVSTNAVGYFAQPEHADDLDHGKRGAYGQWTPINADNSTTDMARMGYCAKPWNGGGSYTWPIPNAWRVVGDGVSTNVFTQTDQRFELDADGTTRLTKFGWGGERGTNCQYRVYEVSGR